MRLTATLILTFVLTLALSGLASAATNRVVNGNFETAGATPTSIPGWTTIAGTASRSVGAGNGGSAGLVLQGPSSVRSADPFNVVAGETLDLRFHVREARDNHDATPTSRGDSVMALEFLTTAGVSVSQLEFHCDAYVDLLDNNLIDGSDTCTAADGYQLIVSANAAITCTSAVCLKYNSPIVVPTGATKARVVLGGSLASDQIDPVTGAGITSPTSLTTFDGVAVGN